MKGPALARRLKAHGSTDAQWLPATRAPVVKALVCMPAATPLHGHAP